MPDRLASVSAVLTPEAGWEVDQQVSYDGTALIVATRDCAGQTFAVSDGAGGTELLWMRDDVVVRRDTFPGFEAALDALVRMSLQ